MAAAEATDSAELILILFFQSPLEEEPRGLFLFFQLNILAIDRMHCL